ncbi:MAG: sugar phosphate isomerase/epimerase [Lachnospiraceae bacterium]|nr:sugar phosphate isomerase/epimerase [Lachnospiraceae bacterium]
MLYGIYNAYWTHEWSANYEYYIPKVKKLGFDVLEISCAALTRDYATDEKIRDLKKCADDNGIVLTAGYGPTKEQNISSEDPAVVKKAMDFFSMIMPKLEMMDIHILGGGLYSYWPLDPTLPMDKEKDLDRAVKNMKQLAKIAEDHGVVLGMEVLNRYEGYMMNTCQEGLDFIHRVDSPSCKVMLDTFHMNIEEDNMAAAIRLAGKDLCHLHLGEQNRQVPGKGSMPWQEIGQALRDINYQGAAVMEPFVMTGGTIGSEIKVWRDIIPNTSEEILDRDARRSVEFVRHVFGI